MSQDKPLYPRQLPPQQPEHYLAILSGLCRANWLALGIIFALGAWLMHGAAFTWPRTGHFTSLYILIALEFGLGNLALALALHFRGWYQRMPREALNRLHHLTVIVLIWDGLHVLGAVEAFGGLNGPLAPVLPLLLMVGFLILPLRQALGFALAFMLSLVVLVLLQISGVLYAPGALGDNFRLLPESLPLSLLVMLATAGAVISLGSAWRNRLDFGALGSHPDDLINPHFGCFTVTTLERRLAEELPRGHRHGSPTSYVLIRLDKLEELMRSEGLDGIDKQLTLLSAAILKHTRLDLDTCAYLGNGCFAVLLPTASRPIAQAVVQRIVFDFAAHTSQTLAHGIATATAEDSLTSPATLQAAAQAALNEDHTDSSS